MPFLNIKNFFKFSLFFAVSLGLILGVACVENPSGYPGLSGTIPVIARTSKPCCNLSVSQHADSLKNLLLAETQASGGDFTLLVFSLALILFGYSRKFFQNIFNRKDFAGYKLYLKNRPQLLLFNCWKFYFALGIPNPKIY